MDSQNKKKSSRIIYATPRDASYKYMTKSGNEYSVYITGVEVIGETAKRYIIRLKQPIRDHKVGDEIEVVKKSIKFKDDCTHAWWHD